MITPVGIKTRHSELKKLGEDILLDNKRPEPWPCCWVSVNWRLEATITYNISNNVRNIVDSGIAKAVASVVIGLGIGGAGFVFGQFSPQLIPLPGVAKDGTPNFATLDDTYETLKRKFDGDIAAEKALDGARAGILESAGDPYTTYLGPEAAKELENDLKGELSGVGAEIGMRSGKLTVIAPISDSPAEKAGLRASDVIARIDKQDTTGLSVDEAVKKIRGQKGTQVTLLVIRGNTEPKEITITRDLISVASVKYSKKDDNIGYIQLTRFGDDTPEKLSEAATSLKSQGATKIILDMRNNPGGYLTGAVSVASQFLEEGKLVVEEKRKGKVYEKLSVTEPGLLVGLPTVVLINEGSASASEIVAGALQDHKVATLIGAKSFGKGSVQDIVKIPGGAQLKITIAHWFTPNGRGIDKEGVKPDIEVAQTAADVEAGRDPQLDRAISELKAK